MKNIISSLMILIVLLSALGAVSASERVNGDGIIILKDDDPNHNYTLKIGQTYALGNSIYKQVRCAAVGAGLLEEVNKTKKLFVPVKVGSVTVPTIVGNFDATEDYTFNFVE